MANVNLESVNVSDRTAWQRVRQILVGSLGNMVEYYDYYAYSAFQLYFSASFFPKGDPVSQNLNTAAIFATGFLMRPIGGFVFGYIADTFGRKRALTSSVLLMCLGSLMIAVTPTYGTIGTLAPIILFIARLLQGLSLGGEYGASATYLAETAQASRRGFYCSFLYVTLIAGQLVAVLVLAILQFLLLSEIELKTWGWRIPFFIGAGLALFTLVMRSNLSETEAFEKQINVVAKKPNPFAALLKFPRESLTVIGLTMGGTLAFYVYTIYMQKFLKLSAGFNDKQSTAITAASLIFAIILQPLYGALSDKLGRRPLLLFFGVAGTLFTYPLLSAIHGTKDAMTAFFLIAVAWLIVSGYTSINAIVKAELFPASIRATGVGVPYAIAVSIFGGSAEWIALTFKTNGVETGFYWYATAVIACSLLVYVTMRDTKQHSRIET